MAMKAKVTKAFNGVKDGEIYPVAFAVGAIVEGDLAAVAVKEGWATSEPKRKEHAGSAASE